MKYFFVSLLKAFFKGVLVFFFVMVVGWFPRWILFQLKMPEEIILEYNKYLILSGVYLCAFLQGAFLTKYFPKDVYVYALSFFAVFSTLTYCLNFLPGMPEVDPVSFVFSWSTFSLLATIEAGVFVGGKYRTKIVRDRQRFGPNFLKTRVKLTAARVFSISLSYVWAFVLVAIIEFVFSFPHNYSINTQISMLIEMFSLIFLGSIHLWIRKSDRILLHFLFVVFVMFFVAAMELAITYS